MQPRTSSEVRARFDAAASSYAAQAELQREIGERLMDRLDGLRIAPDLVLDLGCGPRPTARALARRFRDARVMALDLSAGVLAEARRESGWLQRRFRCIQADACRLPLAEASVDLVFANLLLPWVVDLPALLNGLRRVLRPDGLLLLSGLGPDSASSSPLDALLDPAIQVSDVQRLGDALMRTGFIEPVLDTDWFSTDHRDAAALHQQLVATGLGRPESGIDAAPGKVQAHWEIVFASAWGPQFGAPVRSVHGEEAAVPISGIGRRRRDP